MKVRYYNIMIDATATGESEGWVALSEIEYTQKEADSQLRHLKSLGSPYKFRKKIVREAEVQILTVRRVAPIVTERDGVRV